MAARSIRVMMKELWKTWLVLGAITGLLLGGCGDSVPTGPLSDTLPLEIPTSLAEDVDAIRSAAAETSLSKRVASGGAYSASVTRAGDNVYNVTTGIDELLERLDDLQIPSSTSLSQTTFTYDVPVLIQDRYSMNASYDVDASFADFDIDDDGDTEGCSGNSATVPICLRLWLDDTRTIAAVFTEKPTALTNGVGRVIIDDEMLGGGDFNSQYGFAYNHSDSADRTTEFFNGTAVEGTVPGAGIDTHIKVEVLGTDDDTAIKTVSYTSEFDVGHADGLTETQSVVRWTDTGGVLSGSFTSDLSDTTIDEVCVNLLTGDQVETAQCSAVSIAAESYVPLANKSDYRLPAEANFPLEPDF